MSLNKNHPECGNDEVFITNADNETYLEIGWESKRRGNVAYSRAGELLGNAWRGAFPVFAKKDEIRNYDLKVLERLEA